MVKFTQSLAKWLTTEEGKSYLKGGSNYDPEYAKKIGLE